MGLPGFTDFLSDFVVYFGAFLAVGGLAYWAFWVLGKERFAHRRIQPKRLATKSSIRRELLGCVSTFLIFTLGDDFIEQLKFAGQTRMYDSIGDYGWAYFLGSVVFMILAHDAYFYWTHRLLHHPLLYRRIHSVHHRSTDPSPFTAFSFHPIEAFFQWLISLVFVLSFPTHFLAITFFQVWMTVLNVLGHLGYEPYSADWPRRRLLGLINTSTQHNLHHQRVTGNYGLYFSWWDRLCGTERRDYPAEYAKVHKRIAAASAGSARDRG